MALPPSPPPRAEVDDAVKLWLILDRAHGALQEVAARDVARNQLTLGEYGVLEALYHKGPMFLGELQRKLNVSSGGITYLMDRLEKHGYAERRLCSEDRRARYGVLTESGEALVRDSFPGLSQRIREATSALSEEQIHALTDLLRQLGHHAAEIANAEGQEVLARG